MVAQFQVALGRGHAGARLSIDRSPAGGVPRLRWLLPVTAALTLPFAVALTLSAISSYTHAFRFDGLLSWLGGTHHTGLLLAFGPPLALVVLAVARLRVHGARAGGRWTGRLEARAGGWELVAALVALVIAVIFFGHLAADALACAQGIRSAC